MMKIEELKKYIDLAKEEGVSKLQIEDGDKKVSISFQSTHGVLSTPIQHSSPVQGVAPLISAKEESQFHNVKAPFVGTYYDSPSPDQAAYVKVGDKVTKGQVLCILEAMKIMNEIEADKSGEIVEVCLPNESLVEFGQSLFKIK